MISVVMPAYNASEFISQAIESILKQTFQEFELLVVDDGSQDNTVEIIQRYLDLDNRIKLIQIPHSGVCNASNIGIRESKYQWIARMDADDISLPNRLEKQIKAISRNPKIVALGSYAYHISSQGKILSLQKQGPITPTEFYSLLDRGGIPYVIQPTVLLNKEALLKVGAYDPRFPLAQDLELLSRMSNCGLILALPEPLLLYRVHLSSSSMQKFFLQQNLVGWIVARHSARVAGHLLPTFEEFNDEKNRQNILTLLKKKLERTGQYWYRRAGLLVGEKQYFQASIYLSLAILVYPKYALPRLWKQKFSSEARRSIREKQNFKF